MREEEGRIRQHFFVYLPAKAPRIRTRPLPPLPPFFAARVRAEYKGGFFPLPLFPLRRIWNPEIWAWAPDRGESGGWAPNDGWQFRGWRGKNIRTWDWANKHFQFIITTIYLNLVHSSVSKWILKKGSHSTLHMAAVSSSRIERLRCFFFRWERGLRGK